MKFYARRKLFILSLCLIFLLRLGVGLCAEFRPNDRQQGDERQIYLIGLKFYATGMWPYYGPDVNPQRHETRRQVPGALQGLMVGLPLFVWPVVEAPYVWLNILSFSALALLAWYCTKLLPETPAWFIWAWVMTAPWTLDFSTQVLNISYVLPGSITFFIGALEACPRSSRRLIPFRWATFMMGLGLAWVMQFHMSWVLLVPYALASLYFRLKSYGRQALAAVPHFICGVALAGSFIAPTYIKYGLVGGTGNIASAISFRPPGLLEPLYIPLRFFALASYFVLDGGIMGRDTAEALAFLRAQVWVAPLVVFLSLVGLLQVAAMSVLWFTKKPMPENWQVIRLAALATVCLVYVSFWFTDKKPRIYAFYVILPIAMIYSFYCWNHLLRRARWQALAKAVIVCGILLHIALALHNRTHRSLYVDRRAAQAAIDAKDYRLLGERRIGALY